jgi:hypothetical protein
MRRDRAGSATAARDAGLRRVTRLTWQAAAAGMVASALIAAAFGHGASSAASASTTGQQGAGRGSSGLRIPEQPPAPVPGAGQVTSGAS